MADKRTPIGALTKWVVAPLIVGAVGYYVVGPRIGGSGSSKSTSKTSDLGPENVDPPSPPPSSKKKKTVDEAPNVEVTVEKSPSEDSSSPEPKPKPVHHKHKKPVTAPGDDGSSSSLNPPAQDPPAGG